MYIEEALRAKKAFGLFYFVFVFPKQSRLSVGNLFEKSLPANFRKYPMVFNHIGQIFSSWRPSYALILKLGKKRWTDMIILWFLTGPPLSNLDAHLTLQYYCISSIRSNQFHMCWELKGTTNLYLWRLLHMYVQHFALFICVNWVWQKTRESHSLSSSTPLYLFGKAPQRIWLKLNRVLYVRQVKCVLFFRILTGVYRKIFEHVNTKGFLSPSWEWNLNIIFNLNFFDFWESYFYNSRFSHFTKK